MTNKEKFLKLVSDEKSSALDEVRERLKNRAMLRESQNIALKILMKLDELEWTQIDLAEKMEVSPQYINKIVRGKENFTLETLVKLQKILDIPVLATYYEKHAIVTKEMVSTYSTTITVKVVYMKKQREVNYPANSYTTIRDRKTNSTNTWRLR